MKTGLLIFDNNRKTSLAEKIEVAAKRYREKYGRSPNKIYINTADAEAHPDQFQRARKEIEARGDSLEPQRTITPNHIWLGVSNATPSREQAAQFEQARQAASETQAPRVAAIVKLISGAETDGTDAQDNTPTRIPVEQMTARGLDFETALAQNVEVEL